jgi:aminoacrylate hydrolase
MAGSNVKLEDGAEIAISIDGSGPDLLLVSGLGGTASFWNPVIPELAKTFRVIRLDQRGIGSSTRGTAPTSIDTLATDCFAVLEHVASSRALLLGHSTGGVILQSMALADESRIAGLVLSGTWARRNRYMGELFRSRAEILTAAPREYAGMVAFLGYPADWLNEHWALYQMMIESAPTSYEQQQVVGERIAAIMAFDRSAEIGGIRAPILIQGSEDDLIVPAFLSRELAELMPRAEIAMTPTGGHFFPVTRPEIFIDAVRAFARKIGHI